MNLNQTSTNAWIQKINVGYVILSWIQNGTVFNNNTLTLQNIDVCMALPSEPQENVILSLRGGMGCLALLVSPSMSHCDSRTVYAASDHNAFERMHENERYSNPTGTSLELHWNFIGTSLEHRQQEEEASQEQAAVEIDSTRRQDLKEQPQATSSAP